MEVSARDGARVASYVAAALNAASGSQALCFVDTEWDVDTLQKHVSGALHNGIASVEVILANQAGDSSQLADNRALLPYSVVDTPSGRGVRVVVSAMPRGRVATLCNAKHRSTPHAFADKVTGAFFECLRRVPWRSMLATMDWNGVRVTRLEESVELGTTLPVEHTFLDYKESDSPELYVGTLIALARTVSPGKTAELVFGVEDDACTVVGTRLTGEQVYNLLSTSTSPLNAVRPIIPAECLTVVEQRVTRLEVLRRAADNLVVSDMFVDEAADVQLLGMVCGRAATCTIDEKRVFVAPKGDIDDLLDDVKVLQAFSKVTGKSMSSADVVGVVDGWKDPVSTPVAGATGDMVCGDTGKAGPLGDDALAVRAEARKLVSGWNSVFAIVTPSEAVAREACEALRGDAIWCSNTLYVRVDQRVIQTARRLIPNLSVRTAAGYPFRRSFDSLDAVVDVVSSDCAAAACTRTESGPPFVVYGDLREGADKSAWDRVAANLESILSGWKSVRVAAAFPTDRSNVRRALTCLGGNCILANGCCLAIDTAVEEALSRRKCVYFQRNWRPLKDVEMESEGSLVEVPSYLVRVSVSLQATHADLAGTFFTTKSCEYAHIIAPLPQDASPGAGALDAFGVWLRARVSGHDTVRTAALCHALCGDAHERVLWAGADRPSTDVDALHLGASAYAKRRISFSFDARDSSDSLRNLMLQHERDTPWIVVVHLDDVQGLVDAVRRELPQQRVWMLVGAPLVAGVEERARAAVQCIQADIQAYLHLDIADWFALVAVGEGEDTERGDGGLLPSSVFVPVPRRADIEGDMIDSELTKHAISWMSREQSGPPSWELVHGGFVQETRLMARVRDVIGRIMESGEQRGFRELHLRKCVSACGASAALRYVGACFAETGVWVVHVRDLSPVRDAAAEWCALASRGGPVVVLVDDDVDDGAWKSFLAAGRSIVWGSGALPQIVVVQVLNVSPADVAALGSSAFWHVDPVVPLAELGSMCSGAMRAFVGDENVCAGLSALRAACYDGTLAASESHVFLLGLTVARGNYVPARDLVRGLLRELQGDALKRATAVAFVSAFALRRVEFAQQQHTDSMQVLVRHRLVVRRGDSLRFAHAFFARVFLELVEPTLSFAVFPPAAKPLSALWSRVYRVLFDSCSGAMTAAIARAVLFEPHVLRGFTVFLFSFVTDKSPSPGTVATAESELRGQLTVPGTDVVPHGFVDLYVSRAFRRWSKLSGDLSYARSAVRLAGEACKHLLRGKYDRLARNNLAEARGRLACELDKSEREPAAAADEFLRCHEEFLRLYVEDKEQARTVEQALKCLDGTQYAAWWLSHRRGTHVPQNIIHPDSMWHQPARSLLELTRWL